MVNMVVKVWPSYHYEAPFLSEAMLVYGGH